MVPATAFDKTLDPVEEIQAALEHTWGEVTRAYDITTCMPDLKMLFENADLRHPQSAAQGIIVAMLLEITENIGRFSPWYRLPARSFGILSGIDPQTKCTRWRLAPEAVQKWQAVITPLVELIGNYNGLIRAMILVDDLMSDIPGDPCVTAHCRCNPPREIQLNQSVLIKSEILCSHCRQPYT